MITAVLSVDFDLEELKHSCKEFANIYHNGTLVKELEVEYLHLTECLKDVQTNENELTISISEPYHLLKEAKSKTYFRM